MATVYRPRKGSLTYKFKKVKGSELIPRCSSNSLFYAIKAGMTQQCITSNLIKPVTILQIPKHIVIGYAIYNNKSKIKEFDVFEQIEKYKDKQIRYIVQIDLPSIKSMSYNYKPHRELPIFDKTNIQPIGELNIEKILENYTKLDVTSISKGKGFQGVVKKYGLKLKKRKHARANKTRHIGAISSRGLGRVTRFAKQASPLGCFRRTIHNLDLTKTKHKDKYFKHYGTVSDSISVIGSVPGPAKRIMLLRTPRNVN